MERTYETRDHHVKVRLKESERAMVEMAAAKAGMRVSEWVRMKIIEKMRAEQAALIVADGKGTEGGV